MKVKGYDYPIEWVNEDKSLEALEIIFNDDVVNGRLYRLSAKEIDRIAEIMQFSIPSLPEECFFETKSGLLELRLGTTEMLNFIFELLQATTEKKVTDIQDFLAAEDLNDEEKVAAEKALSNAKENAVSLGKQIRQMQLAYLEALPNPQLTPAEKGNAITIASGDVRQNRQQKNQQQKRQQIKRQQMRRQNS